MKIQHLPIGARFEYQGKVMVKTGPMMAAAENGGQCLVPRHAVLKPLDPVTPQAPVASRQLDERVVREAFERFYLQASRLIDETGRMELARGRQRFLDSLK